jgi:hypothetical protein
MRPGATAHRAGDMEKPAAGCRRCCVRSPPTGPPLRNGQIIEPGAAPAMPHEAVRGNSPRMALAKAEGQAPEAAGAGCPVCKEHPGRPSLRGAGENREGRREPSSSCRRWAVHWLNLNFGVP